jgi:hypothetical protein
MQITREQSGKPTTLRSGVECATSVTSRQNWQSDMQVMQRFLGSRASDENDSEENKSSGSPNRSFADIWWVCLQQSCTSVGVFSFASPPSTFLCSFAFQSLACPSISPRHQYAHQPYWARPLLLLVPLGDVLWSGLGDPSSKSPMARGAR